MATTTPRKPPKAVRSPKTLGHQHKLFIVVRLAKFETSAMVRDAFAKEFPGFPVPSGPTVSHYDPTNKQGASLATDLTILFKETRAEFLKNVKAIPVANKAVRLHLLNDMVYDSLATKNKRMAAEFLEQAAKEAGDVFTNKVDMKHSGKIDTNGMSDGDVIKGLARFGIRATLPAGDGGAGA